MLILLNMLISVNLTWRQCLFNIILVFQSQTMIKTEEDAAMALQVSNALTQALLQYRLKNVPKEVCIIHTKFTISKKSGKEIYVHFKIKLHVATNLVLLVFFSWRVKTADYFLNSIVHNENNNVLGFSH